FHTTIPYIGRVICFTGRIYLSVSYVTFLIMNLLRLEEKRLLVWRQNIPPGVDEYAPEGGFTMATTCE
ncbi:TPA: hypothetical protein ACIU9A_001808, partial [Salmonella enterica subsp. enterica serovar Potsdam]